MRCRIPDRIWFWFLRFVHWFKRGRGSPRFTRLVDLASSEKSKRLVVSHMRKGDFVHFGASLRIMYTAVAHRPTPRPLGIEAIPRLVNRVLSLSFMFFSLPLSFSFFLSLFSLSFIFYLSFYIALPFRVRFKYVELPATNRPEISISYIYVFKCISRFSGTFEFMKYQWR